MTTSLTVEQFGRILLTTQDLDPVYTAIYATSLNESQLARALTAYWCFYHLGVASFLAESREQDFWPLMLEAATNKDKLWPRGTERRHFRGKAAIRSVTELEERFSHPLKLLDYLTQTNKMLTAFLVRKRMEEIYAFGPWISFKVADMLERLTNIKMNFDVDIIEFFETPREGAIMVAEKWGVEDAKTHNPEELLYWVIEELTTEFREYMAPPKFDRPVNIQEIETILCKVKSHWTGHYPVGKDTIEVRHALEGWGDLAGEMKSGMEREMIGERK